jgi:hypothetical protein
MRSPITDEWAAGQARAAADQGLADVLAEVRAELTSLSNRLERLSQLVARAIASGNGNVEGAAAADGPASRSEEGVADPRILAVQLALAGYPREIAETRLAGAAERPELHSILDDVYDGSLVP